ncbi:MAG: four helix bundle protein [Bacteroidota bacterium]
MAKSNVLLEKSYEFALRIVNLTFELQDQLKEVVLTKQVMRSGTAIGALSEEAQQAESKADFIHKLAIANKEAYETDYWLRLMRDSKKFPGNYAEELIQCEELMRLLVAIIKSSKA